MRYNRLEHTQHSVLSAEQLAAHEKRVVKRHFTPVGKLTFYELHEMTWGTDAAQYLGVQTLPERKQDTARRFLVALARTNDMPMRGIVAYIRANEYRSGLLSETMTSNEWRTYERATEMQQNAYKREIEYWLEKLEPPELERSLLGVVPIVIEPEAT